MTSERENTVAKNALLFQELASLFFSTRQIIRAQLPGKPDPNAWLRMETISFVAKAGTPTMHDIATYLRIAAPSATSLVSHLVKDGLLRRVPDTNDKRVVHIAMSAKGTQVLKKYGAASATTMRKAFSALSEEETAELVRILRRVQKVHQA